MGQASRRHRILIVGTGSIGERHLRCFLNTGRAEVSFVEENPATRLTVANHYPSARSLDDLTVALATGIDGAVIATPAPSHVSLATRLTEAGVHVLIEKPLAVEFEGIDELRRAVEERATLAAVAYVYRAHPALAEMREAIASAQFGNPLQIVAVCGQHFPTYRPDYRQTYYASHASGGGAVQDALTHVINVGQWLVGPVNRVVADAAHQAIETLDVEDTVHVIARHQDVLGSYSLNQHQAPNEVTITVVCEHGVARFEYHTCRWRSMRVPGENWQDHPFGPLERDELFIRQAYNFLDSIEGKAMPLCTLDEATETLRASMAILASIRHRSWQEVTA